MAYAYLSGTQCQPKRRRFSGDRRRHSTALTIQQVAAFPDFVDVIAKCIAYNFGYAVIFSLSFLLTTIIILTIRSENCCRLKKTYQEYNIYTTNEYIYFFQARKLSGKALSVPALSRSPSPPSLRSGSASRSVEEKNYCFVLQFYIYSLNQKRIQGRRSQWSGIQVGGNYKYAQISKLLLFHFFGHHPKLFCQTSKLLSHQSGVALSLFWQPSEIVLPILKTSF